MDASQSRYGAVKPPPSSRAWSPASDWVGRPPFLGLVVRHFSGWSPASAWAGHPPVFGMVARKIWVWSPFISQDGHAWLLLAPPRFSSLVACFSGLHTAAAWRVETHPSSWAWCPPVLGLVARQFKCLVPASSWPPPPESGSGSSTEPLRSRGVPSGMATGALALRPRACGRCLAAVRGVRNAVLWGKGEGAKRGCACNSRRAE